MCTWKGIKNSPVDWAVSLRRLPGQDWPALRASTALRTHSGTLNSTGHTGTQPSRSFQSHLRGVPFSSPVPVPLLTCDPANFSPCRPLLPAGPSEMTPPSHVGPRKKVSAGSYTKAADLSFWECRPLPAPLAPSPPWRGGSQKWPQCPSQQSSPEWEGW